MRKWVTAYQEFGEEGFLRNRQQMKYTFQFKQNAVEEIGAHTERPAAAR